MCQCQCASGHLVDAAGHNLDEVLLLDDGEEVPHVLRRDVHHDLLLQAPAAQTRGYQHLVHVTCHTTRVKALIYCLIFRDPQSLHLYKATINWDPSLILLRSHTESAA